MEQFTLTCDKCYTKIPEKQYGACIDPKYGGCTIRDGKARHLCKKCTTEGWSLTIIQEVVYYVHACPN